MVRFQFCAATCCCHYKCGQLLLDVIRGSSKRHLTATSALARECGRRAKRCNSRDKVPPVAFATTLEAGHRILAS